MNIKDCLEKTSSVRLIVKPSSKKTEMLSYDKDKEAFRMNVSSPAEKNRANLEIIKFIKKKYGKDVRITRGLTSRDKVLRVI